MTRLNFSHTALFRIPTLLARRATGWRSPGRAVLVCVTVAVAIAPLHGCSEERRVRKEIEAAFENGEFRETIALCRLAAREGIEAGFVQYYWGASMLELNRDFEAFSRFDKAAKLSTEDRRRSGALLAEKGLADLDTGERDRAAKRLRKAQELDPSIEFGPALFLVADECFRNKDFSRAAVLYDRAVAAHPDTSACEEAFYNLSLSRTALGDTTAAVETLETLLERYPKGEFATDAKFRLESMLFDRAEEAYRSGDYDRSIKTVTELLDRTSNNGLMQRCRYLLGEIHEAQGDYDAAYRAYREVIQGDRGASGRIVQRARSKMDAIREAGLR